MRPRYSFSSRRTGHLENLKKQRAKYPLIITQIIEVSDIILEIIDARFIEKTRNKEIEEDIKKKNKKIIHVINKSDLAEPNALKETLWGLYPYVIVSCKKRMGIKDLRNLIKKISKDIEKLESKTIKKGKIKNSEDGKINVGVIGYPNTGKSSLINLLIGKSSAGVGSDAGFTKNIQKLKLTPEIMLLDTPGLIPEKEYALDSSKKITRHAILGARAYNQVKSPELVISDIIKEYPNVLEKFYNIDSMKDSEIFIEKLGKQKGFLKKGGEVNEDKTARLIIKDWQAGKIKV